MKELPAPPKLGESILIVMDNCPACLDMLKLVISRLPRLNERFFTLLHCCPYLYWEHGGADDPDNQRYLETVEQAEAEEFRQTQQYFEQASAVLQAAGVPKSHIRTQATTEASSPLEAVMAELRQHEHTGVIISSRHADVINRLRGQGVTDMFRRRMNVAVWALETETPVTQAH